MHRRKIMSTTSAPATVTAPTMQQQAGALLTQVAGYAGYRTIAIGLRTGLIRELANGTATTPDDLAQVLELDPFYVSVWCQGAVASGVGVRAEGRLELAPHLATLLLDDTSPAYVGAMFDIFSQPEFFDRFEKELRGTRLWWDECSPDMLRAVSRTSTPFYTRLVPGALDQIPDVARRLRDGTTVADLGSGLGLGLRRLAEHYPRCRVVGVDGDAASIAIARRGIDGTGLGDRVDFLHNPLEELDSEGEFGVVVSNLAMHECRDIDEVTRRVRRSLEPGGWFCISDFPFPEDDETLRSVPGRILAAIQFFEAQIDDQLLPRRTYDELLTRHGFVDLGHLDLTPVHAVTFARRPLE
jgi:SAM-dependent methyltransferase